MSEARHAVFVEYGIDRCHSLIEGGIGLRCWGNPLGEDRWLDQAVAQAARCGVKRIVAWSGSLNDDLFAAHPHNWMSPGQDALRALCEQADNTLRSAGMTLCLVPHARHVLSDANAAVMLTLALEASPIEVALAPTAMLEADMLPRADEHIARFLEALGGRCAIVILEDVAVGECTESRDDDDDENAQPPGRVPLGQGVLRRELMQAMIERHVPQGVPLVVMDELDAETLRAWIE